VRVRDVRRGACATLSALEPPSGRFSVLGAEKRLLGDVLRYGGQAIVVFPKLDLVVVNAGRAQSCHPPRTSGTW